MELETSTIKLIKQRIEVLRLINTGQRLSEVSQLISKQQSQYFDVLTSYFSYKATYLDQSPQGEFLLFGKIRQLHLSVRPALVYRSFSPVNKCPKM